MIDRVAAWFADPSNWTGPGGALAQIGHHLVYTGLAFALAAAIALPVGAYIGHTGRGEVVMLGAANAVRALPTLGLLILLVLVAAPVIASDLAYTGPAIAVLVALAVPPLISGVATGFQAVPRATIDAARGMGCSEWEIVRTIELPCAVPLIFGGVRSAVLQIVATATVAAYVSLEGLGRFILDGRATNDYPEIAAGALLITALALSLDLSLAALQRLLTPAGLRLVPAR